MTPVAINLALGDYARIMPLALGTILPEGLELNLLFGKGGSWPARADMIRRTLVDPTLHGGEGSMGGHLKRINDGDDRFVALPIFLRRGFVGRYLYVKQGSTLTSAKDLTSSRIGMYAWQASGAIWYRHFLRSIGVSLDTVKWTTGGVDVPGPSKYDTSLPVGVASAPADASLSDMLLNGDLDAIYCSKKPKLFSQTRGPIVRMFEEVRSVEEEVYRATKVFPILHLIILRRDVWLEYPWIAGAISKAFSEANRLYGQAHSSFPYDTPWSELDVDEVDDLMGPNFHTYDIEESRTTLEAFFGVAHEVGLTDRRVTVEQFFAEYLDSTSLSSPAVL